MVVQVNNFFSKFIHPFNHSINNEANNPLISHFLKAGKNQNFFLLDLAADLIKGDEIYFKNCLPIGSCRWFSGKAFMAMERRPW